MSDTKRPQINRSVDSSLRDRIAYAIAQADGDLPGMEPDSWDYELADAVIRELGLRREGDKSRTVTNEHGATYRVEGGHRYVTEWENDDSRSA
jgi:hypothetical protein